MRAVVAFRFLLFLAVFGAIFEDAREARAQVVGGGPTITVSSVVGRTSGLRPNTQQPYYVNVADCNSDDAFDFVVSTSALTTQSFQVWVSSGVDCTQSANRVTNSTSCWQVYGSTLTTSITGTHIQIPSHVIAAQRFPGVSNVKGLDPNSPQNDVRQPDDCTNSPATFALTFYFMFVNGSQTSSSATYPLAGTTGTPVNAPGLDLQPPLAPAGVSAQPGNTRVELSWSPSGSADQYSYNIYCEKRPTVLPDGGVLFSASLEPSLRTFAVGDASVTDGSTGAGGTGGTDGGTGGSDAGTGATTGTGGTTGSGNSCSTTVLVSGSDPTTNANIVLCGTVGQNQTTGVAAGLENDVPYVIGVSTVDTSGNIGPLSDNVCATPVETTDPFQLYKMAGGQGGGGFCSMSLGRTTKTAAAASLLAALFGILMLRRRGSSS